MILFLQFSFLQKFPRLKFPDFLSAFLDFSQTFLGKNEFPDKFPDFSLTSLDLAGTLLYSYMLVKIAHKLYTTLMLWENEIWQGSMNFSRSPDWWPQDNDDLSCKENVHFFLLYWPCWTSKENEISWAGSLSTKYIWKFLWYC